MTDRTSNVIQVFNPNHPAYYRLLVAANIIQLFSGVYCMAETTYWDRGQNWKWTTIIAHPDKNDRSGIQILNPNQARQIILGDIDEFLDVVKERANHLKERYQHEQTHLPELPGSDVPRNCGHDDDVAGQ